MAGNHSCRPPQHWCVTAPAYSGAPALRAGASAGPRRRRPAPCRPRRPLLCSLQLAVSRAKIPFQVPVTHCGTVQRPQCRGAVQRAVQLYIQRFWLVAQKHFRAVPSPLLSSISSSFQSWSLQDSLRSSAKASSTCTALSSLKTGGAPLVALPASDVVSHSRSWAACPASGRWSR